MGTYSGKSAKGQATHKSVPTSKLSKQPGVTKPESRHPTTHNYGMSGAHSMAKKVVC